MVDPQGAADGAFGGVAVVEDLDAHGWDLLSYQLDNLSSLRDPAA